MKPLPPYSLLVTAVLVIGFTTWATLARLGGVDQAMISNMYPTSVTPAGYVFSIWTLIYATWIAIGIFALRQQRPQNVIVRAWQTIFGSRENLPLSQLEQYVFGGAMVLTAIWLFPWHFGFIGLSVFVMLALLATLMWLFFISRRAPQWFRLSVELFLGWIIVATLANISIWTVASGLIASDSLNWRIGVLALGAGVNAFFFFRYRTWVIVGVFLWAVIGIFLK